MKRKRRRLDRKKGEETKKAFEKKGWKKEKEIDICIDSF